MTEREETLRKIGSAHAVAMCIVWVRQHIGAIDGRYVQPIHPRHTRKRKERDAQLRPLKELEARMVESHKAIQASYGKHGETQNGVKS